MLLRGETKKSDPIIWQKPNYARDFTIRCALSVKYKPMKYPVILVFSLALFSCGEKFHELPPIAEKPLMQTFYIQTGKDTLIAGKDGTVIKFKNNSLVTRNGDLAEGVATVELTEFYSKKDFIANRLSTNATDNKVLKSSGMVLIEAFAQNGDTLELKEDRPMTIMFRRTGSSRTANLFLGEKGTRGEIRWRMLPPVYNDTIAIFTETILGLSDGEEMVNVNAKIIIGSDTIVVTEDNRAQFRNILDRFRPSRMFISEGDFTTDSVWTRYSPNPAKAYVFETTKFGYLNCDIFIDRERFAFVVESDRNNSDVFVVVDSLNSVFYPTSVSDDGSECVFYIPRNLSISIVAYNKDDDMHFFKVERTKSDSTRMHMVLTETTLENIKAVMLKLTETTWR